MERREGHGGWSLFPTNKKRGTERLPCPGAPLGPDQYQPLHADYGPLCLIPVESHLKGSSLPFLPQGTAYLSSTKLTWQQLDFPGSSAHFPPQAVTRSPSIPPSPSSSLKFPFLLDSQSTCLKMATAFLGRQLCPALSGWGLARSQCWVPRKGLLQLALTLCPQSQALTAVLPGLEGIRALQWMPSCLLGLPLSCPSAIWTRAPTHSVKLPLGVWPNAGHRGEAFPVLGIPRVEAATAVLRDKPVCQGLQ